MSDKEKLKTQPDHEEEEEEEEEEGEEEEEEEEEDEDDEEEVEEEEPLLKYVRLSGSLGKIFAQDNGNFASALAVGDKFLALGTHLGNIYILDFEGNENREKRFTAHTASVNDISIDRYGEYVASCSNDGRVMIHALYNTNNQMNERQVLTYNRPVKAVAIDPDYAKKTDKPVVLGGLEGNLVLNKKGWFTHKDVTIHSGEGPIHAIRWSKGRASNYIAWANDCGVKIFDVSTQQRITYIQRPEGAPRAAMFRCCLVWQEDRDDTLFIGWANCVQIAVIKERGPTSTVGALPLPGSSPAVPTRYVEYQSFITDFYISGLAPFDDNLLILAYDEDEDDEQSDSSKPAKRGALRTAPRPELRIMTRDGEQISSDALTVKGFEKLFATDYRLESYGTDKVFYIVSPRDIIAAKPRNMDDHIKWLLERQRYAQALEKARENLSQLRRYKLIDIGLKYLDHLVKTRDYAKAASLCPTILDKDLWEKYVYTFVQDGKLQEIIPYIPVPLPETRTPKAAPAAKLAGESQSPTATSPTSPTATAEVPEYAVGSKNPNPDNMILSKTLYEMTLAFLLTHDGKEDAFLYAISTWPADLYDIQPIIKALQQQINPVLLSATSTAANTTGTAANLQTANSSIGSMNGDLMTKRQKTLLHALAKLYSYERQYDRTLAIYLRLQDREQRPDVFEFIRQHSLFDAVQDKVPQLMDFNQERALEMLISNIDHIPVRRVVEQLLLQQHQLGMMIQQQQQQQNTKQIAALQQQQQHRRRQLHQYLHELFRKDAVAGRDFHQLQVELYAEFDTEQLLPFLEKSNYIPPEKACDVCQRFIDSGLLDSKKQELLNRARVHLMGRIGNTKEALYIIIDKLADVELAIDFIERQNDDELWVELINHSLKNGNTVFISGLLEHIGAHTDPIRLIQLIPAKMSIPNLRDKLVKIISDYTLQMTLQKGCCRVLESDSKTLSNRLYKIQRKGVRVDGTASNQQRCAICDLAVYSPLSASASASASARSKAAAAAAANATASGSSSTSTPAEVATDDAHASVVFFCGHAYHAACLRSTFTESAPSSRKQQPSVQIADDDDSGTSDYGVKSKGRQPQQQQLSSEEMRWNPSLHFPSRKIFCVVCSRRDGSDKERERK